MKTLNIDMNMKRIIGQSIVIAVGLLLSFPCHSFGFHYKEDKWQSQKQQKIDYPNVVWVSDNKLIPAESYGWFLPDNPRDYHVWIPCRRPTQEEVERNLRDPSTTWIYPCWPEDVRVKPAPGNSWENPDKPGDNDYRTVPLPYGTPHEEHPNVVWAGDGIHFKPADGYVWENPDNHNDYKTVKKITVIEKMAHDTMLAFKDEGMRDWSIKNVGIEIRNGLEWQDIISPWAGNSKLIFTDYFLAATTITQENLIAFETGKAFWIRMKDEPVKGDNSLATWFNSFSSSHMKVFEEMRSAKHGRKNLPRENLQDIGVVDLAANISDGSTFGYIFRAQALQLPEGRKAPQEWNEVIREFRTHIDPLLHRK